MQKLRIWISLAVICILAIGSGQTAAANFPSAEPAAVLLASGLDGGAGSTIGPDGALYVTERYAGRISRVDPQSGDITTYASGLPQALIQVGGAMDVAFIDQTAYVLVTLVDAFLGGHDVVGIYRVDGPTSFTVVADIGTYSENNPPAPAFFVPSGVQYAMQPYRGGFLVTDGHHNRVLWASLKGEITEVIAFGNIVPTGLAAWGNTVYMAEAGPVPHLSEFGKVVAFGTKSPAASEVASGARLLVDVEFGLGRSLYALSQGVWDGVGEGSPAMPNTGSLVSVNDDGTFSPIVTGLDRPTSLEFIGNTAYVVTLIGEIWKIDHVSTPPFGSSQ